MPIGPQDLWVAGSRFLFKPDALDGVEQPYRDFGIIETANPAFNVTTVDLKDGISGINQLVDTRTIRAIESYAIQTRNLALRNWRDLLRAKSVQTFAQAAQTNASKTCTHRFHPGHLVRIQDVDATFLYRIGKVQGVYSSAGTTVGVVTELGHGAGAGPFTIKVTGDLTGANPAVGSFVILKPEGLAAGTAQANSGTYEILSKGAFTGGATVLTVREALSSTETGLTGAIVYKSGAGGGVSAGPNNLVPAWKVRSLDDGVIYAVAGGSINAEGDLIVVYSLGDIASGSRLLLPQTFEGELRGAARLFWSRGSFAEITVRRMRVAVTPSAAQINVENEFSSLTFDVKQLTDDTATDPDGDLFYLKGAVPALS